MVVIPSILPILPINTMLARFEFQRLQEIRLKPKNFRSRSASRSQGKTIAAVNGGRYSAFFTLSCIIAFDADARADGNIGHYDT
jgi:hypothetical protein